MALPIELRIFNEQEVYIREHFGIKAADQANYGWGVDVGDGEISIATKVYGYGVLVSVSTRRSNRSWTPTDHNMEVYS